MCRCGCTDSPEHAHSDPRPHSRHRCEQSSVGKPCRRWPGRPRNGFIVRPVVPPNGCTSLVLRGLALGGARLNVRYTVSVFTATLVSGSTAVVGVQGGGETCDLTVGGTSCSFNITVPGETVFEITVAEQLT